MTEQRAKKLNFQFMDIDPSNDRDHDGKRKDKKEAIPQILAAE